MYLIEKPARHHHSVSIRLMSGKQAVLFAGPPLVALVASFCLGVASVSPRPELVVVSEGASAKHLSKALVPDSEVAIEEGGPPDLGFEDILLLPDSLEREARLQAAVGVMAGSDVERWIDSLRSRPRTRLTSQVRNMLWRRLGEIDPSAALAKAELAPTPEERLSASVAVAAIWTKTDPMQFLDWAQLNAPDRRSRHFGMVVHELGRRGELDSMLTVFASIPQGTDRMSALSSAIGFLAMKDQPRSQTFVDSLTDRAERRMGISAVAFSMTFADPATALEWVSALAPEDQESAASVMASTWVRQRGLMNSLSWLDANPEHPTADAFRATVSSRIAPYDPEEAILVALEIRDERRKGGVVLGLFRNTAVKPKDLIPLVDRVPADQRYLAVNQLANRLSEDSLAEAEDFVRNVSGISEERRQGLLNRLGRQSPAGTRR